MKKVACLGAIALLLNACISISKAQATPTPVRFVTSTLPPTQPAQPKLTLTPPTEPAVCRDAAILVQDVTIPDETNLPRGSTFRKTWRFQNTGECIWVGYAIAFASGDRMNAPASAPVVYTAPGKTVDVSVDLIAPSDDGAYTGNFELRDGSGRPLSIGTEQTFWVKITVGTVVTSTVQASIGSTPAGVPQRGGIANCKYKQNEGYVEQIVALINQARVDAGLSTLALNDQLNAAAKGHSLDMACNNFLGHTGSDGSTIGGRIVASGYSPSTYIEIIAIGTPQDAMRQWHEDAPHWEAVLNAGMIDFGVGYIYVANSDYGGYFTVDFGR